MTIYHRNAYNVDTFVALAEDFARHVQSRVNIFETMSKRSIQADLKRGVFNISSIVRLIGQRFMGFVALILVKRVVIPQVLDGKMTVDEAVDFLRKTREFWKENIRDAEVHPRMQETVKMTFDAQYLEQSIPDWIRKDKAILKRVRAVVLHVENIPEAAMEFNKGINDTITIAIRLLEPLIVYYDLPDEVSYSLEEKSISPVFRDTGEDRMVGEAMDTIRREMPLAVSSRVVDVPDDPFFSIVFKVDIRPSREDFLVAEEAGIPPEQVRREYYVIPGSEYYAHAKMTGERKIRLEAYSIIIRYPYRIVDKAALLLQGGP